MTEPALTIREAAEAVGASERTIRRRIADGAFPNAYRDPADPLGTWRIPRADLATAGFRPRDPEADPVREEIERLRAVVVELRHRAEMAEAVASERAERIRDLTIALRALATAAEQ